MAALLLQALGLVGAFQAAAPDQEHDQRQKQGGHTVKQQKHGLVTLHIQVDLLGFVPDFLLFHLAQGDEHGQVMQAVPHHKGQVPQLRRQVEDAFDHLPVADAAQAHDHRRKPGGRIALPQGRQAGIGGIALGLFCV